jgi:hypothetical protein
MVAHLVNNYFLKIKSTICWDLTLYSLLYMHQRFEGTSYLHLQSERVIYREDGGRKFLRKFFVYPLTYMMLYARKLLSRKCNIINFCSFSLKLKLYLVKHLRFLERHCKWCDGFVTFSRILSQKHSVLGVELWAVNDELEKLWKEGSIF